MSSLSKKILQILVFSLVSNLLGFMEYIFIPRKKQDIVVLRITGEEARVTGEGQVTLQSPLDSLLQRLLLESIKTNCAGF